MGKKLIITGADFSTNAIDQTRVESENLNLSTNWENGTFSTNGVESNSSAVDRSVSIINVSGYDTIKFTLPSGMSPSARMYIVFYSGSTLLTIESTGRFDPAWNTINGVEYQIGSADFGGKTVPEGWDGFRICVGNESYTSTALKVFTAEQRNSIDIRAYR